MRTKNQGKFLKVVDDTIKMTDKSGNGTLKITVSVDQKGKLFRYSLAYINPRLCSLDNGWVLGYDNSHGYHHRHYMGKEHPVDFESYEMIAERFDKEWRELHEKAKRKYHD
jgi:hypothetical protein